MDRTVLNHIINKVNLYGHYEDQIRLKSHEMRRLERLGVSIEPIFHDYHRFTKMEVTD